jgi:hypothetical protein
LRAADRFENKTLRATPHFRFHFGCSRDKKREAGEEISTKKQRLLAAARMAKPLFFYL